MSALHPGVHVLSCPTRWSDVDENGHINNARLVGYVQEGIYDMFCHHETAVRDALFPSGFIIARHEIDFLEQLYHRPEPLSVQLTVERIGRSSTHVVVNVCRDPLTFMRARTVVVARDRESGRSRKLSSNERRFLEAFMPDAVQAVAVPPAAPAVSTVPAVPAAPAVPVTAPPPQRVAARSGAALPHRTRRRCRASVA
ncbi:MULTISPECIES: acyl-CoA thioesterase [unclassified Kitasatospora]|uniref:acyl-CoA thioesterase n=1 Tax=unclassified Kitasatospora TaxID=2633591 RepID=UPI0037F80AD0